MKKPSQAARIADLEERLALIDDALIAIGKRIAKLEPNPSSTREMNAFDNLPGEIRQEIRQYGLHDLPHLQAMLDNGEITPAQFVYRIRLEAQRRGIRRESDEPIRRKRIR